MSRSILITCVSISESIGSVDNFTNSDSLISSKRIDDGDDTQNTSTG